MPDIFPAAVKDCLGQYIGDKGDTGEKEVPINKKSWPRGCFKSMRYQTVGWQESWHKWYVSHLFLFHARSSDQAFGGVKDLVVWDSDPNILKLETQDPVVLSGKWAGV